MYPDRDTLNNVSRSGYIAARDQSMVESGVTEGGKNTARSASYPDVSLDVRAKEGGKETTSVPFPWSLAVYHQSLVSRSPLPCEKRSAWGGGCRQVLPVYFFVNEHNNANTKPQAKKQRFLKSSQKFPGEKQQLVEEKEADNIRKVLLFANHSFSGFEN